MFLIDSQKVIFFDFKFFLSPDVTTENNGLRIFFQVPMSLRKIIPLKFRPCSFPLYHWKRKINDFGVFFSVWHQNLENILFFAVMTSGLWKYFEINLFLNPHLYLNSYPNPNSNPYYNPYPNPYPNPYHNPYPKPKPSNPNPKLKP